MALPVGNEGSEGKLGNTLSLLPPVDDVTDGESTLFKIFAEMAFPTSG